MAARHYCRFDPPRRAFVHLAGGEALERCESACATVELTDNMGHGDPLDVAGIVR